MKEIIVKGVKSVLWYAIIVPVVVTIIYTLAALSGIILLGLFIDFQAAIALGLIFGGSFIHVWLACKDDEEGGGFWWIVAFLAVGFATLFSVNILWIALILYIIAILREFA